MSAKRNFDTSGQLLQNKRARPGNNDPNIKAKVNLFISSLYNKLLLIFGLVYPVAPAAPSMNASLAHVGENNLLLGIDVFKQLASVHNVQRQRLNGKGNRSTKYDAGSVIVIKFQGSDYSTTPTLAIQAHTESMTAAALANTKGEAWWGTAQALIALWSLYGERLKEARIGPDGVTFVKSPTEKGVIPISQFGVTASLRQFATGINWSLPVQSALAQTMGPLAVAIQLARANDQLYIGKWVQALTRNISHIPSHEVIVNYIKEGTPNTCRSVIAALGKVLIIMGSRNQERVAFPPHLIAHMTNQQMNDMDFSGKGAFSTYVARGLFDVVTGLDIHLVQQLDFHASFGSYNEDLGILSQMTHHKNWYNRSHFQDTFVKMKNKDVITSQTVAPVKLKYWSKMSSSSMVSFLNQGSEPTNAKMLFSGYRTRKFTESMRQTLSSSLPEYKQKMSEVEILGMLENTTRKLLEITGSKDYQAGTKKWEDMLGNEVELVLTENGVTYWSSD